MAATKVTESAAADQGVLALWRFYERMDRLRKGQGKWLESLGWGAQETPSRIVLQRPELVLKGYAGAAADGPPILLVPAPIKQAYIWDLAPGASVVGACLEHGLRPYLVYWQQPGPGTGLDDYADRLLGACLAAIRTECGDRPVALSGHSLGGILAAVFASLHPDAVGALVLLGSPLHFSFGHDEGILGPVIEAVEKRGLLDAMPGRMPGSLLSQAGFMASPMAFGRERWQDWLRSLPTAEARRTHMQVERWSLDEMPLARQLVEDLVRRLYHGDALLRGTLRVGNLTASARAIVAPLLVVGDRMCPVVPPASVLPFYERVASAEKRWLWYDGDVGVAIRHVGMLVGRNAHALLWPQIMEWIRRIQPV